MDESGYIQLDMTRPKDFWEFRAGYLIRHYILPRRRHHSAKDKRDCPVPVDKLDPVRVTMKKLPDYLVKIVTDNSQHLHTITKRGLDWRCGLPTEWGDQEGIWNICQPICQKGNSATENFCQAKA